MIVSMAFKPFCEIERGHERKGMASAMPIRPQAEPNLLRSPQGIVAAVAVAFTQSSSLNEARV